MSNQRLDDFAYNLIRLLSSETAYQELVTFAAYQARSNEPFDPEDTDYFNRQAIAMEQAAAALTAARDRVIAEYNANLEQSMPKEESLNETLFPWTGLKGVQA